MERKPNKITPYSEYLKYASQEFWGVPRLFMYPLLLKILRLAYLVLWFLVLNTITLLVWVFMALTAPVSISLLAWAEYYLQKPIDGE